MPSWPIPPATLRRCQTGTTQKRRKKTNSWETFPITPICWSNNFSTTGTNHLSASTPPASPRSSWPTSRMRVLENKPTRRTSTVSIPKRSKTKTRCKSRFWPTECYSSKAVSLRMRSLVNRLPLTISGTLSWIVTRCSSTTQPFWPGKQWSQGRSLLIPTGSWRRRVSMMISIWISLTGRHKTSSLLPSIHQFSSGTPPPQLSMSSATSERTTKSLLWAGRREGHISASEPSLDRCKFGT